MACPVASVHVQNPLVCWDCSIFTLSDNVTYVTHMLQQQLTKACKHVEGTYLIAPDITCKPCLQSQSEGSRGTTACHGQAHRQKGSMQVPNVKYFTNALQPFVWQERAIWPAAGSAKECVKSQSKAAQTAVQRNIQVQKPFETKLRRRRLGTQQVPQFVEQI